MKKHLLSMFALASMLLATGCSQEEEIVSSALEEKVEASFTLDLGEGVASRTVGDGTKATQLYYGVFDQAGNVIPTQHQVKTFEGKTTTVTFKLVKGQTYDFVFWAQSPDNKHYVINPQNLTEISVNYDQPANDETRDAFLGQLLDFKVDGHFTKTVTLTRPFAQLNVGTTKADYELAKTLLSVKGEKVVNKSNLIINKAYTKFNTLTKEVGAPIENAEFVLEYRPTEYLYVDINKDGIDETTEADQYEYLSLNYLLASEESEMFNVKVQLNSDEDVINTLEVPNVPIQRNYRTNIVGNLLTTTGDFTVIVDNSFLKPNYIVVGWDGTVAENVEANAEGVYEIYDASQLAWFAKQVDNGNTFSGKTVKLMNNIDLANNEWNPIGVSGDGKPFSGIFDGNGKTISNLYVNLAKTPAYQSAGLFANASNAIIKNFTIENAYVANSTLYGTSSCGTAVVVGSAQFAATIENVDVKNATIVGDRYTGGIAGYFAGSISNCDVDGIDITVIPIKNDAGTYDHGDKVGGILGYHNSGQNVTSNNTVNDFTIKAYRDMGGIAGTGRGVFTNNRVSNGTITVDQTYAPYNESPQAANADEIVGRPISATIDDAENFENVNIISDAQNIVNTQEAFATALNAGGTIYVGKNIGTRAAAADYTWTVPSKSFKVIAVEEGVVIDMNNSDGKSLGGNGISAEFEGVTLQFANVEYSGFQHSVSETYTGCIIEGYLKSYAPVVTFTNCEFNQTADNQYNLNMYGPGSLTITDCKFYTTGKSMFAYNEHGGQFDITITDTRFEASKTIAEKAAIQMHTEYGIYGSLTLNNVTANGFDTSLNGGLWNELNNSSKVVTDNFVKTIDGIIYVQTAEGITNAVKSAKAGNNTIAFTRDLTGNATIFQAENKDIVIDGNGKKYNGTIYVSGSNRSEGLETLAIQNINFEANTNDGETLYFINSYAEEITGKNDYAHNITIKECSFNDLGAGSTLAIRLHQDYNIKVEDCVGEDLYGFLWSTGGNGITLDGVTVTDTKNGASFGTTDNILVKDSKIETTGVKYAYALRADGNGAYKMEVKSSTLKADAPILIRKATADYALTLTGINTLTALNADGYQIIPTAGNDYGYDDKGNLIELVKSSTIKITGAEGMKIFK